MLTQPLNILIVEDSPVFVELLSETIKGLKMAGISRNIARDADDALRKFREQMPDITFLDINLPDGSGLDLLDIFLKIAPDAYIVMITGDAHSESVGRACSGGAQGYILKPFQPRRIHDIMQRYLKDISARPRDGKSFVRNDLAPPEYPSLPKAPSSEATVLLTEEITKHWRALVVSEDEESVHMMRRTLTPYGCSIEVCFSGQDAWTCVEKKFFELVILDSNLTDIDAYQVANQLRLRRLRQPVKSFVLLLQQPEEESSLHKEQMVGITKAIVKEDLSEKFAPLLATWAQQYQSLMAEAYQQ